MRRTACLSAAWSLTTALAAGTAWGEADPTPDPVVVELFTSQGCSSCPPADAMLGELAARDGVVALSLHVDYWDWIGWADTFAQPAFSDRQRAYAAAAGSRMVYTPQFTVGGTDHVAGPRGMAVGDAVAAHAEAARDVLGVDGAGRLTLAPAEAATLRMAYVQPEATVAIERGENAGRAATYHNIVREMADLGPWDGTAGVRDLPPARGGLRRVVFAQAEAKGGKPGRIVGAVVVD